MEARYQQMMQTLKLQHQQEVTSELQRLGELQFYYGVSERNQ